MARMKLTDQQFKRLGLKRTGVAQRAQPCKRTRATRSVIGSGKAVVLDDPALLLRVRLPVRLTNGNAGRGFHWRDSANFRKQIGGLLIAWGLKRTPFEFPVKVHLIRVLARREHVWDTSNWQLGNWKQILDALTARNKGAVAYAGWFHDDNPQWISDATFANEVHERPDESAIIIEVRKS